MNTNTHHSGHTHTCSLHSASNMVYQLFFFLPLSLARSLTCSLTHSHPHSLTPSLSLSLAHYLSHSLPLSPSLSHSLTTSLTPSLSLSLALTLSHILNTCDFFPENEKMSITDLDIYISTLVLSLHHTLTTLHHHHVTPSPLHLLMYTFTINLFHPAPQSPPMTSHHTHQATIHTFTYH